MSDILIRGMEMPRESRVKVLLLHADGTVIEHIGPFVEIPSGKAIELPEHGRLGDLDALVESLRRYALYHSNNPSTVAINYDNILNLIEEADTIIPASGGDEG